jgi:hypothetical protein
MNKQALPLQSFLERGIYQTQMFTVWKGPIQSGCIKQLIATIGTRLIPSGSKLLLVMGLSFYEGFLVKALYISVFYCIIMYCLGRNEWNIVFLVSYTCMIVVKHGWELLTALYYFWDFF